MNEVGEKLRKELHENFCGTHWLQVIPLEEVGGGARVVRGEQRFDRAVLPAICSAADSRSRN